MSYSIDPLLIDHFKGIREYNGVNNNGMLSALRCINVDLVQTEVGDCTGIKSSLGNSKTYELPDGFSVEGIFKSSQDGINYIFVYGENDQKGVLYCVNPVTNILEVIIDNLSKTGKCNGLTMTSTAYDVFIFTNGVENKTVCFTADSAYGDRVQTINATDYQGRTIHWLSMTDWNGFLVVASEYGVHSSHQNDIYTWNDDPQDIADSWFIDFSKKITAVVSFTNGLYIFSDDDTTFLSSTPNDENSQMKTASMNGCFSYTSFIKHDTYLFFYDNNQKNIYYMAITDTGQTRPAGPVAKEVQSAFLDVKKFKMFSCIFDNHNEIWCLINDNVYLFDYNRQEWTIRAEQNLNTVCLVNNAVLTGGNLGYIYTENTSTAFDGMFYPSVYESTFINIGSNSNMKKQKTPILLVLNDTVTNDFFVQLTCDGKEKGEKRIKVKKKNITYYGNAVYGTDTYSLINNYGKKVVEVSTPQTWYTLKVKIYTKEPLQSFYIHSMELKNMKLKTKTRGR